MEIKIHSISYTNVDERKIERWLNRMIEQTLFSELELSKGWMMRLTIEDHLNERNIESPCLDQD